MEETLHGDGAADAAPIHERIVKAQQDLKAEAKALVDQAKVLGKVAAALGPLSKIKAYADLVKLPKAIDAVEKKVTGIPGGTVVGARALALARQDLESRRRRVREGLSRELQEACAARGLSFRVVRREEPIEIRLPPFAVVIDREKGSAEVRFAQMPIEACPADAAAIVAARDRALVAMNATGDSAAFHEACRRAWLAARAAVDGAVQDRVEILDFLPYLAIQLQAQKFKVDPSVRNYKGYSRARFAWDILKLRKSAGLVQGEWRLNLGVATGTTASKKNRVIWFEDENGEGEFKLTVFFTKVESAS